MSNSGNSIFQKKKIAVILKHYKGTELFCFPSQTETHPIWYLTICSHDSNAYMNHTLLRQWLNTFCNPQQQFFIELSVSYSIEPI